MRNGRNNIIGKNATITNIGKRKYSTLFDINWTGEWQTNDGTTWIYGRSAIVTKILRRLEGSITYDTMGDYTVVNPLYLAEKIYATSTPDLVFVLVYLPATFETHLLRSDDGGLTYSLAFILGEGNGPGGINTPCSILFSFCEVKVAYPGGGGVGDLIVGEYNAAAGRIPGSTNDRVRILRSTDDGANWSVIMNWNADGSTNQVRHIHNIQQDPYTGYIYIGTGDEDNKSAIIRWDGATAWTDNILLANIDALPGFECITGSQKYRTVSLIFTSDYMFSFTDCGKLDDPTFSNTGIWRGAKDLSTWERVDNSLMTLGFDQYNCGWVGFNINGILVYTSCQTNLSSHIASPVFISYGIGTKWKVADASFQWIDAGPYQPGWYHTMNGKIYLNNIKCADGGTNIWEVIEV